MSTRLKLENLIFARAADLHATVWGKNGALACASTDGLLQSYLRVYNRFFAAENQAEYEEPEESFWANYFASTFFYRGGLIPFQSVKSEILVQEKINTYLNCCFLFL